MSQVDVKNASVRRHIVLNLRDGYNVQDWHTSSQEREMIILYPSSVCLEGVPPFDKEASASVGAGCLPLVTFYIVPEVASSS